MEKRKIYGLIIGVTAFILVALSFSYAYFYWSSGDARTNVNLTVTKSLKNYIVYNQGQSILGTDNATLEASDTYAGGISATIEFWKKPLTSANIYGEISLEIIKMLSASGTTDANIVKTNTVKWAITTYTASNQTETLVNSGTFYGKKLNDKFSITNSIKLNSFQTFYKIYIWLDETDFNINNSVVGEQLSVEISASASDISGISGTSSLAVLTRLGLDDELKNTTPNFTTIATTDEGIFAAEDDLGTSYYFRGASENNYVKFGKTSTGEDMYWRIVRINGDGTIRMIYDGTSKHTNGEVSADRQIGTSKYFTSIQDNTYVGYMYGNTNADTYEMTHSNNTNSTIKGVVDNWYKDNIVGTEYEQYIADAIYCNNRRIGTGGNGVGDIPTFYYERGVRTSAISPSFRCYQKNDRFTQSSELGNGKLTYPVGLITASEANYAGSVGQYGSYAANNTNYYLYTGNPFWSMTPNGYTPSDDSYATVLTISGSSCVNGSTNCYPGGIGSWSVNLTLGVRPVISLKANTNFIGDGSYNNPFEVVNQAKNTLINLGLEDLYNGGTPSFTNVATTDEGIYAAEDDFGTSYYFRGASENNYVYFANKYWRIIRINGDGTIRMIYDGTTKHRNGEVSDDRIIGTGMYNTMNNDNTYVGYMYGKSSASTFDDVHSNISESNAKKIIDDWYRDNISETRYEKYISDAIYCNNRELGNLGDGIGTTATRYNGYSLVYGDNPLPSLKCSRIADRFTLNSEIGNGKLTYPIGLITADEVSMAGALPGRSTSIDLTNNRTFYLYNGNNTWTMTPVVYNSTSSAGVAIFYIGYIDSNNIRTSSNGFQPVISLKADTKFTGDGSYDNPFEVIEPAENTLINLGLDDLYNEGTPDFTSVATTDEGIYAAEDDLGTSYYFRGASENNYVYFANKYWRIIRINGDGTVRMIYDGTSAHANGESSTDRQIGTGRYNLNSGDNAYVGYMYGTVGASSYADTHSNTTNSNIKTIVDNWYRDNLSGTIYEQYIADAIYCNERRIGTDGNGIEKNETKYLSWEVASGDVTDTPPTLNCYQKNDRFTKSTELGNGKLTYPVGLITSQEAVLAGTNQAAGNENFFNNKYYLYTGNDFWTMTPHSYSTTNYAVVQFISGLDDNTLFPGGVGSWNVYSGQYGVRPVISLKANAKFTGEGTYANPFTIS